MEPLNSSVERWELLWKDEHVVFFTQPVPLGSPCPRLSVRALPTSCFHKAPALRRFSVAQVRTVSGTLARPRSAQVGAPSSGFFCVLLSEGILDTASAGLFFVSQKNLVTGHTPSANTDRKSCEFIHVCVWMPAAVCMWEAEDTWEVSWLSPSTMCPGTWWKAGTVTRGAIMPAPHFVILR